MISNATFVMTHFLKLFYNVFILENKIDALMFRKFCVKMCYITLEIALVCVNMERVSFQCMFLDPLQRLYSLLLLAQIADLNIVTIPSSYGLCDIVHAKFSLLGRHLQQDVGASLYSQEACWLQQLLLPMSHDDCPLYNGISKCYRTIIIGQRQQ